MLYDCGTHSCLWYLNFIAIPSFVCPRLACIELLISLYNDRYLFADGFVTVRPIAIKFGWDKENVSYWKFRKFNLDPTNFNRKSTMMSAPAQRCNMLYYTFYNFWRHVTNIVVQLVTSVDILFVWLKIKCMWNVRFVYELLLRRMYKGRIWNWTPSMQLMFMSTH